MAAPTIVASILTGGSNNHATSSEEVNGIATDFVSEGIVGTYTNTSGVAPATGAFACNASGTPDANINISTGVAYVTATPSSQNSQTIRINCSVTGTLAISANSSGSTKYDWIYISIDATNAANPNTAGDNVATIVASRSSSASTDDGTPPTYGYPIAVVTVANGFTTITDGNIRDVRTNAIVNLGSSSVSSGWLDLGYTPNTVTALGNRSYSMVFNNTDLTGTISPGMRLKTTRLATAPTQCTDLESGSSQYYSKTSPSGLSFTTTFTCSAWVKLESYTAGGIIARRNADTEGWDLSINSSGQVTLNGLRIAANSKTIASYQSIPLNKWVHVAACLDMTAGDTAAQIIWIDGVQVPRAYTLNGTATAIVQGTTALVVGAQKSAGTNPFDGKIAQAAVFSACLSDATVKAMATQTLTGSETNLVSAYSFNNTINDLNTSNANNLTAQGSAVATNADSPFSVNSFGTATGTTDYGIVTAATFSTNTTLTVQVPEGCTIPTSGGVSAVAYSVQKVPYGMPVDIGKWRVNTLLHTDNATTSNATYGSFMSGGFQIIAPVGAWNIGIRGGRFQNASTTTVCFALSDTVLTGLAANVGSLVTPLVIVMTSPSASTTASSAYSSTYRQLSSAATFVMYSFGATTSGGINAASGSCELFAEFALL